MLLRCCHIHKLLWILIIGESVLSDNVQKAVNSEAKFTPLSGSVPAGTSSIIWKHRDNAGVVVKVIEWDREEGSTEIPNAKFKSHASLDKNTGELTLKYLQLKHSGVYSTEINSKEQKRHFVLTVLEPVRKPYITKECSRSPPVCHMTCKGDVTSESTITWKNSAGQTLNEQDQNMRLTVTNSSDPDTYYTCTLQNAVSKETSDPVYGRDLFTDSKAGIVFGIVICLIVVILTVIIIRVRSAVCIGRHKNYRK
ncbi:T-lymphocyte surface antigen Ly-9 isoform X1 [Myxocyprinus asiaticus]|uniref:T-lymphocyte surface antigen Ly-9 isoform X1 n=1 Tax=Myxocyprinus asiaticus TaxID=70543 RepID=UPI00222265D6|nr:T-lymphocyte surface antigen Ly-9 isoform X1 [Myxocyprinus asiaticus]